MIAPAVDAQQDSELVEIQAEAETTPAKVIRSPETPSVKNMLEHRGAGHIPTGASANGACEAMVSTTNIGPPLQSLA